MSKPSVWWMLAEISRKVLSAYTHEMWKYEWNSSPSMLPEISRKVLSVYTHEMWN